MEDPFLHIISFNVPYPADYGGVIDVFYKIRALKDAGIRIILHCFTYGRQPSKELESLCFKVYYYRRKKGLPYFFSRTPYITLTRTSNIMPKRLLEDNFPVLFEGLHSTYYIKAISGSNKTLIVRAHNIEHTYYRQLARQETNIFRKIFLLTEALKLKKYESILENADHILGISESDTSYFSRKYNKVHFIPAFHPSDQIHIPDGRGSYLLYHGNLSVAENHHAARYLVKEVFSRTAHPVIIAGKDPQEGLINLVSAYPNIQIEANPDEERMRELIRNAHINVLFTFQATGIKLKLLHTLFSGRFCMVNQPMVEGSELASLCSLVNNTDEALREIDMLMGREMSVDEIRQRKKLLEFYSNSSGAEKIRRLL